MQSTRDKVVVVLNDLIGICRNSEDLFRTASQEVQNRDLKKLFQLYSEQRFRFMMEIQAEMYFLGGQPTSSHGFGGVLRRGWLDGRKERMKDDDAIISECIHFEDAVMNEFEAALFEGLPDSIRALISKQHNKIRETARHLHELEKAAIAI